MSRDDSRSLWFVRVPLARPSGLGLAAAAQIAGAAVCVGASLAWLGVPVWASIMASAALPVLVRRGHRRKSPPQPGALVTHTDPSGWRVLTDQGWQPARLRRAEPGGGRLSLMLDTPEVRGLRLTVWRASQRPATWRRLCAVTFSVNRP